jgi:hypothetical protein
MSRVLADGKVFEKAGVPKLQAEVAGLAEEIAVGKVISSTASKMYNFTSGAMSRLSGVNGQVKFAKNVRKSFFNAKRDAGIKFEKSVDDLSIKNPTLKASAEQAVIDLKNEIANDPKSQIMLKSGLKKSKVLHRVIEDPSLAKELTLREIIDLKSDIKDIPGMATKINKGQSANWTPEDIPFVDFVDNLKL